MFVLKFRTDGHDFVAAPDLPRMADLTTAHILAQVQSDFHNGVRQGVIRSHFGVEIGHWDADAPEDE